MRFILHIPKVVALKVSKEELIKIMLRMPTYEEAAKVLNVKLDDVGRYVRYKLSKKEQLHLKKAMFINRIEFINPGIVNKLGTVPDIQLCKEYKRTVITIARYRKIFGVQSWRMQTEGY